MEKEKKDISEQVRSDVTMLEEISRLKKDVAEYKKSGDEMGLEILHLRRQNAALRGINKSLKERVEHYKNLDLEGDVLYEGKISEVEELEKMVKGLNDRLYHTEHAFMASMDKQKKSIEEMNILKTRNDALSKELFRLKEKKPWYKRIF